MQGTPLPTAPSILILAAYSVPRVQGVLHRSHTSEVTNFIDTRTLSLFAAEAFLPFAFAIPITPLPILLVEVQHYMEIRLDVCMHRM